MQKLNINHEQDFNIFSSVKKQPSERVKLPEFQVNRNYIFKTEIIQFHANNLYLTEYYWWCS